MKQVEEQMNVYKDFYSGFRTLRWLFRFDVRYRCNRLPEVLEESGIDVSGKRVLDVGFGSGKLLATFPHSCALTGADISASAVEAARVDPIFANRDGSFVQCSEEDPEDLPSGPFDVILSSHTLEHVPCDVQALAAIHKRLEADGLFILFVPIEEPNYIPVHRRNYSPETITALVNNAGFEVIHAEGSMHINGHVWKIITIPSRHRWPVVRPLVDAFRLVNLSMVPYRAQLQIDKMLGALGFGPRQYLLVCRKAEPPLLPQARPLSARI